MDSLNYQKTYWQNFIKTSEADVLAKDLNSYWNAQNGSYTDATEIPKEMLDVLVKNNCLNKVLDFGVGFGRNQKYLSSLFKEVHGFDLPEMISKVQEKKLTENKLFSNFNELDEDYSLVYEATAFQHMPPQEVLFYLMMLSLRAKFLFLWTRSYNDFGRNFILKMGGLNMAHLVGATSCCWELIFSSEPKMYSLNDESHFFILYKSKTTQ